MRRFKKVLCVIERELDETVALRRAVQIAERNGAELTVTYCVEEMPEEGRGSDPLLSDLWRDLGNAWQERLDELVAGARDAGVAVRTTVQGGTAFVGIIRAVIRRGHDLVVKSASAVEGAAALNFGSTDLHLLRKCPCPVWTQQGEAGAGYRRILAAVDVAAPGDQAVGLNRLIMDLATSLSVIDGSDLHVVHAVAPAVGGAVRRLAFTRGMDDWLGSRNAEQMERRRTALEALTGPYRERGFAMRQHLLDGDPVLIVPDHASREGVDLIVMGTVGRTGLPGLMIGNVAEDIIRQVDCSVLAVKPEGFVSPVGFDDDAAWPVA